MSFSYYDGILAGDRVELAEKQSLRRLSEAERARFVEPRLDAPLDRDLVLAEVPRAATIAGMFPQALVQAATAAGFALPSARRRYTAFSFYPLEEHLCLVFEACDVIFPGVAKRRALRRLGRWAPDALLKSTIGRVMLSSAIEPHSALEAFCKTYAINLKPGYAEVSAHGDGWAIVDLRDVHVMLDCHQVGAFEGLMGRLFGVREPVLCASGAPGKAEFLIRW